MMPVIAASAGPVTDTAPAPSAANGLPVAARLRRKTSGAVAAPTGTVSAPCAAYGQIAAQFCS